MSIREDNDFKDSLARTYLRLHSEGEITRSADKIPCTEDHERVWVNMIQCFPCTMNDVAVALINLRKSGRLKATECDASAIRS